MTALLLNEASRARVERHDVDPREPFRGMGRLELPLIAELHRRTERGNVALRDRLNLVGLEQPSVARHDPPHGVDLCVLDARGK